MTRHVVHASGSPVAELAAAEFTLAFIQTRVTRRFARDPSLMANLRRRLDGASESRAMRYLRNARWQCWSLAEGGDASSDRANFVLPASANRTAPRASIPPNMALPILSR